MQQITHEFKCNLPSSFFSKTEEGEYCSACKSVVIDFTEKSNDEILNILSANSGTVCGSAYGNQFNQETSSRTLRKTAAVAGLAALLGLVPEIAKAQATEVVKTEIVFQSNQASNFGAVSVENDVAPAPAIESPDKPTKKPKEVKRKTFLRIGRRSFFVKNVFPFIGTSRTFYGRYRAV